MAKRPKLESILGAMVGIATASAACAEAIPYQSIGDYNSITYAFTAVSSGDLTGYFVGGSGAAYHNAIGILVNGVQLGDFALGNHRSSLGESYTFGRVNAGDKLVFVLRCYTLGLNAYSDPRMNALYDDVSDVALQNHIYSTAYSASDSGLLGMPSGIYVGFEDLRSPYSDYNYNDESVIFTNVAYQVTSMMSSPVPEPSTWGMMLIGFAGLAYSVRRRHAAL